MWQGSAVYRCVLCGASMTTAGTREDKLYKCSETPHVSRKQALLDEYLDALVIGRLGAPMHTWCSTQRRWICRRSGAKVMRCGADWTLW